MEDFTFQAMKKHRPKKSLGQNFLQDQKALKKIVFAADLTVEDNVLEIGPGKGALTAKLLEKAKQVLVIEKDAELARQLEENFQLKIDEGKLESIVGDILEINLSKLLEERQFTDYKLVANIPYYITGQILRLFFETKYPPKLLVLLVQKEVAERIVEKNGRSTILSLAVQLFGEAEIVDYVPKESFFPAPKVDSAIIKIEPSFNQLSLKESKKLMRLIKTGFASPRKTLVNNLAAGWQIEKSEVLKLLKKLIWSENLRAENLKLKDWKALGKLAAESGLSENSK